MQCLCVSKNVVAETIFFWWGGFSVTFSNSRSNLVANKFQVFAQVSLARQQNINCLQLAEFPPLSCSRGQSGAGSEQTCCGNRSTPSRLHSSHPPRCFCQIAKITRQSEAQLAAAAAAAAAVRACMRPQRAELIWCLLDFVFWKEPSHNKERDEEPISELRSWGYLRGGGLNRAGLESGGLCEAAFCASSRCWFGSLVISELRGIQLKTSVGGAACLNAAGAKDKPRLFG